MPSATSVLSYIFMSTALFTGVKTRMAVLGIDGTPSYNTCDPQLLEKSKLKSLLHKAIEDGKATGMQV